VKVRHGVAAVVISAGAIGFGATAAFGVPGASTNPPVPSVVGTGGTAPEVLPATQTAPPATPAAQSAAPATAPSGPSLPLTGSDIAELTIIGVALIGGGAIVVRRSRARASD